jgi:hypothetical protein
VPSNTSQAEATPPSSSNSINSSAMGAVSLKLPWARMRRRSSASPPSRKRIFDRNRCPITSAVSAHCSKAQAPANSKVQ